MKSNEKPQPPEPGDEGCNQKPAARNTDVELPDPILDALSELYWQERCPDL